jgi:TPR repeat protein
MNNGFIITAFTAAALCALPPSYGFCGPLEDALVLAGNDNTRALALAKPEADKGAPVAEYVLGRMYANGWGVARDTAAAQVFFAAALSAAKPAADKGDAAAQFVLGALSERGYAEGRDYDTAFNWYLKAAAQNYAPAENNIAALYRNASGALKNPAMALAWYGKAAAQGYATAQHNLGIMYQNGEGVKADIKTALAWYRKAAAQNYPPALTQLGVLYETGQGADRDPASALAYYSRAADAGFAEAQFHMGMLYEQGIGVARSAETATQWYSKAAAQGNHAALEKLSASGGPDGETCPLGAARFEDMKTHDTRMINRERAAQQNGGEGGWIGAALKAPGEDDAMTRRPGAYVQSVTPGSPADKSGMRPGDILIYCDYQEIKTPHDMVVLAAGHKPGSELECDALRGENKVTLFMVVGANPGADAAAQYYDDGGSAARQESAPQKRPRK